MPLPGLLRPLCETPCEGRCKRLESGGPGQALARARYRTGDAACWLPGPCPCGVPLRRLGPVQGRLAMNEMSAGGMAIEQPQKGHDQA